MEPTLRSFTAAVVHEIRTPLTALSGEVELALRRDRSPRDYREALQRIAQQVTELVDLTGDLALLGDPEEFLSLSQSTADLDDITAQLSSLYTPARLDLKGVPAHRRVAGNQVLLTRAFRLLLDHALRYHDTPTPVCLSEAAQADGERDGQVDLILGTSPPGFSSHVWRHLMDDGDTGDAVGTPGMLRLRTAKDIVRMSGGALTVDASQGPLSVRIQLRQAPAGSSTPAADPR